VTLKKRTRGKILFAHKYIMLFFCLSTLIFPNWLSLNSNHFLLFFLLILNMKRKKTLIYNMNKVLLNNYFFNHFWIEPYVIIISTISFFTISLSCVCRWKYVIVLLVVNISLNCYSSHIQLIILVYFLS
jgi:hypothetical protein